MGLAIEGSMVDRCSLGLDFESKALTVKAEVPAFGRARAVLLTRE
jgi:hypothetical protein